MTPGNAMKILKGLYPDLSLAGKVAIDAAVEALEKQTAKKPNLEGDGYDDSGNIIYDTWICPGCEERYEVDYDDFDYCPKCGQRIDWSDIT